MCTPTHPTDNHDRGSAPRAQISFHFNRFQAFINGKHVVAKVKEKEQAHREYKEAVAAGKGAYLMDEEPAGNIFTVSIGNLPPQVQICFIFCSLGSFLCIIVVFLCQLRKHRVNGCPLYLGRGVHQDHVRHRASHRKRRCSVLPAHECGPAPGDLPPCAHSLPPCHLKLHIAHQLILRIHTYTCKQTYVYILHILSLSVDMIYFHIYYLAWHYQRAKALQSSAQQTTGTVAGSADAATEVTLGVAVGVQMAYDITNVVSLTHSVRVKKVGTRATVELINASGSLSDGDFELRFGCWVMVES